MRMAPPVAAPLPLAAALVLLGLQLAAAVYKETFTQQQQKRQGQPRPSPSPANPLGAPQNEIIVEAAPPESAKECQSAFHCWRAEPVFQDGVPVALAGRIAKRILIGELSDRRTRGGKCRCKTGYCLYYSVADARYLSCQEF